MAKNKSKIEFLFSQPSYWIEEINGILYNAIIDYMEEKNMNNTDLAKHLGISNGRVSQILNDGEINYGIKKIIEISLKIGKIPKFELKDKNELISRILDCETKTIHFDYSESISRNLDVKQTRIIPLKKDIEIPFLENQYSN